MTGKLTSVLFAGGGTGGHIYMAIALARKLQSRNASMRFLFTGTPSGLENSIVPAAGFALRNIRIGGLKNVGLKKTVSTLLQLPGSFLGAIKIVKDFRPDLIVGVGGYSSGPIVIAGRLFGIRSMLIEPNVLPGLTNRLLCPFASGIAVSYEETVSRFGRKARVTGVPVRSEFHEIAPSEIHPKPLRILVFGGSRGSRPINRMILESLPFLERADVQIAHQTGPADYEMVLESYQNSGVSFEVMSYIDDMPAYFRKCDLIISRSGASTIAEITAAGKPAVLIPFPQAADDHQRVNAQALVSRGAAITLDQDESSGEDLAKTINRLAKDRTVVHTMAVSAKKLAQPFSTEKIIQFMEELVA